MSVEETPTSGSSSRKVSGFPIGDASGGTGSEAGSEPGAVPGVPAQHRPDTDLDYRALFTALPSPCFVLGVDLTILDCNDAAVALSGRSRAHLVGRRLCEVFGDIMSAHGEGAAEAVRTSVRRAVESGKVQVLPLQRYDVDLPGKTAADQGVRYWIATTVPVSRGTGKAAVLHRIQDVTAIIAAFDIGGSRPDATTGSHSQDDMQALARELTRETQQLHATIDQEHRIGLILQQAMLPSQIPPAARGRTAVRYRPADPSFNVCGDWYDVLAPSDGRIAIAVGDVVGQGLAAATVMGQLRSALSALTMADVGPASCLMTLDRYARQSDRATATTAVKVVVNDEAHTATYSSAGHLPPILLQPDGKAELLDQATGPPLATTPDPEPRPEATTRFVPGATLVLYTDGLVELHDEDIDRGIARLIATVRRHRGLGPELLADAILAELADKSPVRDDIALVVYRL